MTNQPISNSSRSSKVINPYLSRSKPPGGSSVAPKAVVDKKDSSTVASRTNVVATMAPSQTLALSKHSSSSTAFTAPSLTPQVTASTTSSHTTAKTVLEASKAQQLQQQQQVPPPGLSLKAKLKQDIDNLKRKQQLQMLLIQKEKQRKQLKKMQVKENNRTTQATVIMPSTKSAVVVTSEATIPSKAILAPAAALTPRTTTNLEQSVPVTNGKPRADREIVNEPTESDNSLSTTTKIANNHNARTTLTGNVAASIQQPNPPAMQVSMTLPSTTTTAAVSVSRGVSSWNTHHTIAPRAVGWNASTALPLAILPQHRMHPPYYGYHPMTQQQQHPDLRTGAWWMEQQGYYASPYLCAAASWNGATTPWGALLQQPQQQPQQQPPAPWTATTHPAIMTTPSLRRQQQRRKPLERVKLGIHRIAELKHPNPLAWTHSVILEPVVLMRTSTEPSFGVTLHLQSEPALVPIEWIEQQQSKPKTSLSTAESTIIIPTAEAVKSGESKANAPPASDTTTGTASLMSANPVVQPQQRRRRRYYFTALGVQDPTIQNDRINAAAAAAQTLQPGDLIVQIEGQSTAGMTFDQAVASIKQCQRPDADGIIRCTVVVARRKSVAPTYSTTVTSKIPKSVPQARLSTTELKAFARCIVKASLDIGTRVLGTLTADTTVQSWMKHESGLSSRSVVLTKVFWQAFQTDVKQQAFAQAEAFWKRQWESETDEVKSSMPDSYLSDAQRSTMRARSRPAKGCKCGSESHDYVNDPKCPLYSNLRMLAPAPLLDGASSDDISKRLEAKMPRVFKVVQKAFKDRFVRIKTQQEAEENEAKFVSRMEEIQLTVCRQAVFAPSLMAIVLSAVVELQSWCDEQRFDVPVGPEGGSLSNLEPGAVPQRNHDVAASDDDDDVPLAALGKRTVESDSDARPSKKAKKDVMIRSRFLAKLLNYVSNKWGHVYREPSDMEHAWRWEVFHGQHEDSGSKWQATFKNPRKEGTLSLEYFRFMADDACISAIDSRTATVVESDRAQAVVASMLPTNVSGLCDELLALIVMGVLRVDGRGVPILSQDWWEDADLLLLEDMQYLWGPAIDPMGKHGIDDGMRRVLAEKWRRTNRGWVFSDEPDAIIFDFEEFDEWREAFEEKQQARTDDREGIGSFGI